MPSIDWDNLVNAARAVREHAYAPYSSYSVGAALLSGSGRVYTGCNVENASYGLSICAERVAVAAMVADGERTIRALVVMTGGDAPGPPCGMCLQMLVEFADDIPIHLASTRPGVLTRATSLSKLLPEPFHARLLKGIREHKNSP